MMYYLIRDRWFFEKKRILRNNPTSYYHLSVVDDTYLSLCDGSLWIVEFNSQFSVLNLQLTWLVLLSVSYLGSIGFFFFGDFPNPIHEDTFSGV